MGVLVRARIVVASVRRRQRGHVVFVRWKMRGGRSLVWRVGGGVHRRRLENALHQPRRAATAMRLRMREAKPLPPHCLLNHLTLLKQMERQAY